MGLAQQSMSPPAAAGAAIASYAYAAAPELQPSPGYSGLLASAPPQGPTQHQHQQPDDEPQGVERSDGSLLNWSRPGGRRPAQPPTSAAPAAGKLPASAWPAAAAVEEQQGAKGSSPIRSFLRSAKSTPASLGRTLKGDAAPAVKPPPPPVPQAAAAALNVDLNASVRNWQRQQAGGSLLDAANGSAAAGGLEVDPRSDSLLQWRLPPRAQSSRAAAAGAAAPASASASPARVGSALTRTYNSFKRMFNGPEASPDKQQQDGGRQASEEQQPGSPGWTIPAVRPEPAPPAPAAAAPAPPPHAARFPARPALTVVVPQHDSDLQQNQQQPESPESPGKAAERHTRLRQLSERRRVWSAPFTQQPQPEAEPGADAASASPAASAGSNGSGVPASGSPGPDGSSPGQRPPSGSPGQRPGLQALKARSRTARLLSSGSVGSALGAAGSSLYSLEAVNDVFGPDLVRSPSQPAWSPAKAAAAGGEAATPKVRWRACVWVAGDGW